MSNGGKARDGCASPGSDGGERFYSREQRAAPWLKRRISRGFLAEKYGDSLRLALAARRLVGQWGRGGGRRRRLVGLVEVHAARVAGSACRGRIRVARAALFAPGLAAPAWRPLAATAFAARFAASVTARLAATSLSGGLGALLLRRGLRGGPAALPALSRLATRLGGLRGGPSRLESLGVAHLDLAVDEPLDGGEERTILGAHQRQRLSGLARAAGAADAVHVILGNVRQVEVHDVRKILDVEAARGDVGRDQHLHLAFLEILERADAR